MSEKTDKNYSENDITVLEGTEGIRLRPAMYIGDVGSRGLHHLIYEVIDNSIDEAMAYRCSAVDVVIYEDNSVSIRDNGAGIPADMHPKYNKYTLELILTKIHSGGKFDKKAYQVSGGLHGVGLAAVCALSEWFVVKSYRNGKIYEQLYERGKPVTEVKISPIGDNYDGTLIHFKPDSQIFTVTEFDFDILAGRFKELSYLTVGFRINFTDMRQKDEHGKPKFVSFYSEGGIKQFVADTLKNKPPLLPNTPIFFTIATVDLVVVNVALSYTDTYQETILGYVNNINTTEGGTHISGFKSALTRTINEFARDFKLLKDNESNLSGNDVREGIVAIVSVKVPEPQFEGQTKTKLGNSEIDGIVQTALSKSLKNWLIDNQDMGKAIVNKSIQARRAREAAKKAKELIRKQSNRVSLPGKLVSSRERDPMKRELFLVEGQSAGGTAVKARDAGFQEILFLRGKVLNVEKARINRVLENQEIRNIISAIGAGMKEEFDLSKCRYGKVILLTDADVDGAHIATLLFTFFYRYMHPLIEDGRLFIARPPLYKISLKGKAASYLKGKGKKNNYIYLQKDKDLNALLMAFEEMKIDKKDVVINRFKGLGEMNSDQLEETTMNINTRSIECVKIHNKVDAETWLSNLMGNMVDFRKKFIKDGVFEAIGLENKGPFFDIAFDTIESNLDTTDEDEIIETTDDFDNYVPEDDAESLLFKALEQLK